MLECGKNYKGTMDETCKECRVTDNEDHRLNECRIREQTNNICGSGRVNFRDIYSSDLETLKRITREIDKVWEIKYANGRMRRV